MDEGDGLRGDAATGYVKCTLLARPACATVPDQRGGIARPAAHEDARRPVPAGVTCLSARGVVVQRHAPAASTVIHAITGYVLTPHPLR